MRIHRKPLHGIPPVHPIVPVQGARAVKREPKLPQEQKRKKPGLGEEGKGRHVDTEAYSERHKYLNK